MITYLILANVFLAICYGFYHVFLRQETFFQCNRLFLLSGLLFAFLLPLVDLDTALGDASATYHVYLPAIQIGGAAAEEAAVLAASPSTMVSANSAWAGLAWAYWAGCLAAGLVFLYKLVMTYRLLRSGTGAQSYSFFGKVHVDTSIGDHDKIELHETVHARQWHSLDVVLLELVKFFNWFNPVVYLYARALKLQHEYIADRETSVGQPVQYAELLLSTALGTSRPLLTTPFAESRFLKRRIQMLLRAKSRHAALAKFALLLPVVVAMLAISMAFSSRALVSNPADEEAVRVFREEIGKNTRYPILAIENNMGGDVVAAYEKKDGQYVDIEFLDDSHADLHASVQHTLESDKVKALAPEGKNAVNVKFRVIGNTNLTVSAPPIPAGYTDLGEVTIVGYGASRPDTLAEKERNVVFETVEISPEPPGGLNAFRMWIGQNYVYPQKAIDAGVNGNVVISFVVERDGSLTDIRILRDLKHGTGEEAVRVLKEAPKWSPGIQNGRPVRVAYTMPIRLATQ